MTDPTPLRVLSFKAENMMRLRVVDCEFGEGVTVIGGDNAAGKTSLMDSLAVVLGGMELCPKEPIRKGEETAFVEVQLAGYQRERAEPGLQIVVRREFSWKGEGALRKVQTKLILLNEHGVPIPRPQAFLDSLLGSLSFDPIAFQQMAPLARAKQLRELVGLDVEQLQQDRSDQYELRTIAQREKLRLEAIAHDDRFHEGVPDEVQSVTALAAKMAVEVDRQRELEELKGIAARKDRSVEAFQDALAGAIGQIETAKHAVAEIRGGLEGAHADYQTAANAVHAHESAEQAEDMASIQAEIASVEEVNEKVRDNDRHDEKAAAHDEQATEWKRLDEEVKRLDGEILKRTQAVTYPIEGLSLEPDGVHFQGVPFEQAARSEQIQVCLAMGAALQPRLRMILVRDGSLLDDASMAQIREFAAKGGYQFLIEMARGYEGAECIVIEDGSIAE